MESQMQWLGTVSPDTIVSRDTFGDVAATDTGRPQYAIPSTTAPGSPEGLLNHDLPRSSGPQDFDPMPLQSERVDRSELHLLRKVGSATTNPCG